MTDNHHWVQFPIKDNLLPNDYAAVRENGYEMTPASDSGFTGQSTIEFAPGVLATVLPVMAGELTFQPDDPAAASSYTGGTPADMTGAYRLAFYGHKTPAYLESLVGWEYTIPKYAYYKNVEIQAPHWSWIEDRLRERSFVLQDAQQSQLLEAGNESHLPDKLRAFLLGQVSIPVQQDDELGVSSQLTLVLGSFLDNSLLAAEEPTTLQEMIEHWPIPLSYFYTAMNLHPDCWALFRKEPDPHHQNHALVSELLVDSDADGAIDAALVAAAWTRVRVCMPSWRDYPDMYLGGSTELKSPRPPKDIDSYILSLTGLTGNPLAVNLPVSGETYLPAGSYSLQLLDASQLNAVPIYERGAANATPSTSLAVSPRPALDITQQAMPGALTYGVVSVFPWRIMTIIMDKLETMGASPAVRPAVSHANGQPTTGEEIEAVLLSNPDFLFLGGHFYDRLHRALDEPPVINVFFHDDAIHIQHQSNTNWPTQNIDGHNLPTRTIQNPDFSNSKAVFMEGCALFKGYKLGAEASNPIAYRFAETFKRNNDYPLIFSWNEMTNRYAVEALFDGDEPFLEKLYDDPLTPLEDGSAADWYLDTAKKNGQSRAAVMNADGDIYRYLAGYLGEEWCYMGNVFGGEVEGCPNIPW